MSENRVTWVFLGTALLALGWGIWLKVQRPGESGPGAVEWVRIDGKLLERGSLKPYQGVRALPFEQAPGMVEWEYTYVDGVRQGPAIEYYPSPDKEKVKSRRTYVAGKVQGPVIKYHSNGVVLSKATAVDGLLDGLGIFYREDGTVIERMVYARSTPAGVPAIVVEPELVAEEEATGEGAGGGVELAEESGEVPRMLGPDGAPFTGTQLGTYHGGAKAFEHGYRDGREEGAQRGWHPDGQAEYERPYLDGRKHGTWRLWAEDGKLLSESTFHHGLQVGAATTWFPSGQLRQQSQFVHGAEHGVRSNHDAAGRKRRETNFDHGRQTGIKEWLIGEELNREESTQLAEGLELSIEAGDEPTEESIPIPVDAEVLDSGMVLGLRYRVSSDDADPPPGAARAFRISVVMNGSVIGYTDCEGELGGWRSSEWLVNVVAGDTLELAVAASAGPFRIDLEGIGFGTDAEDGEKIESESSEEVEGPAAAE